MKTASFISMQVLLLFVSTISIAAGLFFLYLTIGEIEFAAKVFCITMGLLFLLSGIVFLGVMFEFHKEFKKI